MSDREKQIEELAEILRKKCDATPNGRRISKLCCACRAETVIEAGYRKQEDGEWEIVKGSNGKEKMVCTNCRHQQDLASTFTYCPNCGAKMKGGK